MTTVFELLRCLEDHQVEDFSRHRTFAEVFNPRPTAVRVHLAQEWMPPDQDPCVWIAEVGCDLELRTEQTPRAEAKEAAKAVREILDIVMSNGYASGYLAGQRDSEHQRHPKFQPLPMAIDGQWVSVHRRAARRQDEHQTRLDDTRKQIAESTQAVMAEVAASGFDKSDEVSLTEILGLLSAPPPREQLRSALRRPRQPSAGRRPAKWLWSDASSRLLDLAIMTHLQAHGAIWHLVNEVLEDDRRDPLAPVVVLRSLD